MAAMTLTDYPDEVLKWMRHKEDQHPSYQKASPQLSMRGSLVDFMRHVCESLKLSVLTTHLGVHLLDRFMDSHNISNNQLRLSALTVIFLAAKFEEKDVNIPRISQLNAFAEGRYSLHIFNRMETFMLNFFDWNVGTVTPAHFVEFFLMYGITPEDYSEADKLAYPSTIHRKLWFSTQHYLDISLQDTAFQQWKCSKVAAACMVCGRLHTQLLPTWPPTLEITTGYSLSSLSTLIDTLLRGSKNFATEELTDQIPTMLNYIKGNDGSDLWVEEERLSKIQLSQSPSSESTNLDSAMKTDSDSATTSDMLAELEEKVNVCCTPESGYRSGCSSLQASPSTPQNYT